jgi:hypothetical protein
VGALAGVVVGVGGGLLLLLPHFLLPWGLASWVLGAHLVLVHQQQVLLLLPSELQLQHWQLRAQELLLPQQQQPLALGHPVPLPLPLHHVQSGPM